MSESRTDSLRFAVYGRLGCPLICGWLEHSSPRLVGWLVGVSVCLCVCVCVSYHGTGNVWAHRQALPHVTNVFPSSTNFIMFSTPHAKQVRTSCTHLANNAKQTAHTRHALTARGTVSAHFANVSWLTASACQRYSLIGLRPGQASGICAEEPIFVRLFCFVVACQVYLQIAESGSWTNEKKQAHAFT